MPDTVGTPNIFLDTEVFDAHQLHFDSPNIRRLAGLAVDGKVQLLLPTVAEPSERTSPIPEERIGGA